MIWNRMQQRAEEARLRRSVRNAYRDFARRHPLWAQSLFDLHLLERAIIRNPGTGSEPTAAELAAAWAAQLGGDPSEPSRLSAGAICVAQDFLDLLEANGGRRPVGSRRSSDGPGPRGLAATPRTA